MKYFYKNLVKIKIAKDPELYFHDINWLKNTRRILIIGAPGTGKTWLTKRISKILKKIPIHLDDYYWQKNWQRLDMNQWTNKLKNLCQMEEWIMDGNHANTLEIRLKQADLIIFLDYSVVISLWRYFWRSLRRYLGSKDQLPAAIASDEKYKPKFTINFKFIYFILTFKIKTKSKMLNMIKQCNKPLICLKSRKQTNYFVKNLLNE